MTPVLLALLLVAQDRERLAILASAISAEGEEIEVTAVMVADTIAKRASFALDLEVVPRAELLSGGLEDRLRACNADLACVSERLGEQRIQLALVAVADVRGARAISSLELIDGTSRSVIGRSIAELEPARPRAPSLLASLEKQSEKLLDEAGHALGGRVVVEVSPGDAIVVLDPDMMRETTTSNTFIVAPGAHAVLVTSEGYEARRLEVNVERGRETRVEARLDPAQSIFASPWLWSAVGAVALGATVAIVIVASGASPCTCVGLMEPCNGCR